MKVLLVIVAIIVLSAIVAIAYLKYRLDNAVNNRDQVAAIDTEVANIENHSALSNTLQSMQRPVNETGTGIGWMQPSFIDRFFGNTAIVWYNGMVGGYTAYIAIDRQINAGVIVLSNKAIDVTMLGTMLMRQTRTQSWPMAK